MWRHVRWVNGILLLRGWVCSTRQGAWTLSEQFLFSYSRSGLLKCTVFVLQSQGRLVRHFGKPHHYGSWRVDVDGGIGQASNSFAGKKANFTRSYLVLTLERERTNEDISA